MNIKKTLDSIVVWYNPTTGKVSLAKCRKTGRFVSLSVAQGMLNVELKAFHLPSVKPIKLTYSFIAMVVFVVGALLAIGVSALVIGLTVHSSGIVAALYALLIPVFVGLAALGVDECIEVRLT